MRSEYHFKYTNLTKQLTAFSIVLRLLFSLYQRTPLHIASKEGYKYTVECLVAEGADINIEDDKGVSVTIMYAAGQNWFTYVTVVAVGCLYFSQLTVVNQYESQLFSICCCFSLHQRTPLKVADERGHVNVAKFLREYVSICNYIVVVDYYC